MQPPKYIFVTDKTESLSISSRMEIMIKNKIRISEKFDCHFQLTNTNNSFSQIHGNKEIHSDGKVKDLIMWIEHNNKQNDRKEKYMTNPKDMSVNKVLPKLKSFDLEDDIYIF